MSGSVFPSLAAQLVDGCVGDRAWNGVRRYGLNRSVGLTGPVVAGTCSGLGTGGGMTVLPSGDAGYFTGQIRAGVGMANGSVAFAGAWSGSSGAMFWACDWATLAPSFAANVWTIAYTLTRAIVPGELLLIHGELLNP